MSGRMSAEPACKKSGALRSQVNAVRQTEGPRRFLQKDLGSGALAQQPKPTGG